MHRRLSLRFLPLLILAGLLAGCDAMVGSKTDPTTDEIFDAGRIDPGLVREVDYVPLFPFFTRGGNGLALQNPRDVYVGYDEFIYVVDDQGLHVLNLAGGAATFVPIDGGGTNVVQDRRLDVYVTARRDTSVGGRTWRLPVVYRFTGITTGAPRVADIIWHPFDDDSRKFNRPDPIATDEAVAFTGVAVLADNSVYVARRGPVNDVTSVVLPHNTVLLFSPEGVNTKAIVALSPTRPSLRSAINPADVLTHVHPPQRSAFSTREDFFIAQSPGAGAPLQYPVLSVRATVTPDGIVYQPDTERLVTASDPTRGSGFLYEPFKFEDPTDLAFAADATNYLFVLDAGKDSLFTFTSAGIEGVAPPPGARSNTPVVVSFGGTGDGARQFRNPQGVGYFSRVVYVADTGNNRISRFRLNTDFE